MFCLLVVYDVFDQFFRSITIQIHQVMHTRILITGFCCLIILAITGMPAAFGQIGTAIPSHRQYATQIRMRGLQTVPGVADSMSSIERFTANFRGSGYMDTTSVALVFHLMPLPGGTALPSSADIQAQINRLNIDFFAPAHPYLAESYQHPSLLFDTLGHVTGTQADLQSYWHEADRKEGFAESAGLPLIKFCLASIDPNGQPTSGILQPSGTPRSWSIGDSICSSSLGGSNAWNTLRYCNVWVARLADGYAGYAQMPGGPSVTDGIVIDDRFFARAEADTTNPYYLGRTLVHLMGSYLNLYELWSEFYPCSDDYVEDTPVHSSANDGLAFYKHVSLCPGQDDVVEMTSNLMDNTDDTGQYLFTKGQVLRMQATLAENGPRSALRHTPTSCLPGSFIVPELESRSGFQITEDHEIEVTMRTFPNPAMGHFSIELISPHPKAADIYIYNALGSLSLSWSKTLIDGVYRRQIDTSGWSAGIYTIAVVIENKRLTQKVLIDK